MKRICFILGFMLLYFSGISQHFDSGVLDEIAKADKEGFRLKSDFTESNNYSDYNLVYQRMEWSVDPAIKYIAGSVTSYFKSLVEELNEIEFDLNSEMIVDSVKQRDIPLNFILENNRLTISLDNTLRLNELDSVQVYYQGEPDKKNEEIFSVTYHSGVPVLWTLSEPYGAMEWWPCKQSLIDKIDSIDVIVTCPDAYKTASNGILVSDVAESVLRKMHWKHRYPIVTYLVAIAVTNYVDYSDTLRFDDGRTMPILNYVYPEYLNTAKIESPNTAKVMKIFNDLIGEYPFSKEKYGHAQFGWSGGMEHQTMSFMFDLRFDLLAHELAHQWFGNYITLGTWQDIWLNEGFATYMTGLTYENFEDGEYWPSWKRITLNSIVSSPEGSVFVKDTTDIDRIFSSRLSYSKGAYLLHMLRWILGDEAFFAGIQQYFKDPKIGGGFASNSQFIKHMEEAGDTSLIEFFNDWYYGEGYPVYSANYVNQNNGVLKITLSQSTSHSSVNFFEMPVPVRVYNSDKTDSLDFRLANTSNNQEFFVNIDFEVAELKIDPEKWIISKTSQIVKNKAVHSLNDIIIYPNPFGETISVYVPVNEQIISARLFSANGVLIREFVGNQTTFNCKDIANGNYIFSITTKGGQFAQKVVKQ
ncbi:MAG: M1 family aminopeptidase [Draconibacterium sp.]